MILLNHKTKTKKYTVVQRCFHSRLLITSFTFLHDRSYSSTIKYEKSLSTMTISLGENHKIKIKKHKKKYNLGNQT